eukprot:TRINITY_DN2660_c0_g2_i1.p4 TRINITY_DN2660_c0_g2~~TRINITY_DN2660_c0_g2_i1.p4  ORF type:complete len:230 (-),score=1.81 TRINITY_DN2660_c0_g2_i1:291-884(-)
MMRVGLTGISRNREILYYGIICQNDRRQRLSCKVPGFMQNYLQQPEPQRNPKEVTTIFTKEGILRLHNQGILDDEGWNRIQRQYCPLPTTDEQGLCIAGTFDLSATNGIDPTRRIYVQGFCRSAEYFSEVIEDVVISKGGEVMLQTTELKHGISESVEMMVAMPLLWGIPAELDTLRQAIINGGGIVHQERKHWLIY